MGRKPLEVSAEVKQFILDHVSLKDEVAVVKLNTTLTLAKPVSLGQYRLLRKRVGVVKKRGRQKTSE